MVRISDYGFRVWVFGVGVSGFGFGVSSSYFQVRSFGFRFSGSLRQIHCLGFRIPGVRFMFSRIEFFGFRVLGSWLKVEGYRRFGGDRER